ncbi:dymeclin isoform X2 [Agrilus planipennis]|uniref:Dymeclin n=1 Tax=Agrilus planipennis TaxID=224129 RepID=A0A1W4XC94_AGRPL|nr:dymeclin isoform X2 [Agrilus planipennis]
MGTGASADVTRNEYVSRFVGKENISSNDPFWNRFLAFNSPSLIIKDQNFMLETNSRTQFEQLIENNSYSNNVGTLIKIFLLKVSELVEAIDTSDNLFIWQTHNALYIIRHILKYMVENLTEEQILQHLENKFESAEQTRTFIGSLIELLVDIPVVEVTYLLHLEVVISLIILLAVQLNSSNTDNSIIYHIIMKGTHNIHAPLLVKRLLQNYIDQKKLPPSVRNYGHHSMVFGIASGLWSIITFNQEKRDNPAVNMVEEPLASQSLMLLLLLINISINDSNPYRQCLFTCSDNSGTITSGLTSQVTSFKIDYNKLFEALHRHGNMDSVTLLEYILLHRNLSFKTYVVQHDNIDELIIPTLKTLYSIPNCNSHHIYMSLIILLILSEDDVFNKKVHRIKIKSSSWFTERNIPDISLGGLLVLVIVRTIQYNMLRMRDKYLHTNCLAALANMSAHFSDLHPYVCQRFLSLFETLAKRYSRLQEKLKLEKERSGAGANVISINEESNTEQDIVVLEEILRMVLEILNSCLSSQLTKNENLVYTLLYKKDIFENYRKNPIFADIMKNLDIIIKYFSDLLEKKQPQLENDYNEVFSLIRAESKYWPKEKLTKFPELKFKYVEEDHPEEFFVPYVWSLVVQHSLLQWNTNDVTLFSPIC